MLKAKPELPYLTIGGFAKACGCSEEDILHRGIAGQVKICALGNYWTLQEGYFSDDAPEGLPVPTKDRGSGLKPIPLTCHALRKILSDGEVIDPEFIFEADGTQDQCESSEQYERFLSSVVISNDMESLRGKVIVKKADLVVRKEDAEAFLVANNDQASNEDKIYDLSTMKKEDREPLVLEYAARVWEEYQKEHKGKLPRIGYVHNQIKQNNNFIRTEKNKRGEPTPSYKTITKEITEERIIKIVQSRKSAEKRG